MTQLLIGNAFSLLGSLLMVYVGLVKDKKRILLLQCVQFLLLMSGHLTLGAYTGAISCLCSLLRNLVCFFFPYTLPVKLGFLALQIIPSVFANQAGWIGWLPIASTCIFTWFLDIRDERRFKLLMLLTLLFWCVYDITFRNYAAFTFDVLTVITSVVSLISLSRKNSEN